MKEKIKKCLKEKTISMFSEEWYIETSEYIFNKISDLNNDGYVYIIKSISTGEIKIGMSANIHQRLIDIKSYVGDIIVIGLIKCDNPFLVERKFHDKFRIYRTRGEWFEFYDIDDLISEIKESGGAVINKEFKNHVNVISNYFMKFFDNYLIEIPEDIYDYFVDIQLNSNGIYDKKELYNNIPFEHNYTQRKVTEFVRLFISKSGFKYKEKKSGEKRTIQVYKD